MQSSEMKYHQNNLKSFDVAPEKSLTTAAVAVTAAGSCH
jgi:hypothetical protein